MITMKKLFTFRLLLCLALPATAQNNYNNERLANGIDTIQKFASDSAGRVFIVDSSNAEKVGDDYHTVSYNTKAVAPFEQLSLEERFKPENPIRIFPNPVQSDATIQFPSLDMYYVNILNSKGEIVYDQKELLNSVRIDWLSFPTGLYYVRTMNMNSNAIYTSQVYKL